MRRASARWLRCCASVARPVLLLQVQLQQQQRYASSTSSSGSNDDGSSDDAAAQQQRRELDEMMEKEARALARVALYPHRTLTRPVQQVTLEQVRAPQFLSRLFDLSQLANEVSCISFSAPKAHWDAAVLLIKGRPDEDTFEVWVNPRVAHEHDTHNVLDGSASSSSSRGGGDGGGGAPANAIASLCGMWENCVSCGSCFAWVVRPQRITCYGLDEHGKERGPVVLDGMRARCFLHELDHLHGKSIVQTAAGPDHVVSAAAMMQRDLWPASYPSPEAALTGQMQLFDYATNTVIVPPGLQWFHEHYMQTQQFASQRLDV